MKMNNVLGKKLAGFSFLIVMMLSASIADAQDTNFLGGDRSSRFGIKGGVNLSNLLVDEDNIDNGWKVGWHAGLFAKVPLNDLFAIQPEVLYTNVGSKLSYGNSDFADLLGIQPGEVRFNLGYVQVPFLASLTLGPISLQAGPYASYLVNANIKNLESDDPLNADAIANLDTDDFNRIDYGLAGGIAVDVKGFQLGARYNYGLREIGKSDFAGRLTNDSRNSVGQVFIAVGF